MTSDARAHVERLFSLVESDTKLDRSVRERVTKLRVLLSTNPDLAYERLCEFSTGVGSKLPRIEPSEALSRFVSVMVFYLYHLDPDVRAFFSTPEDYRRYLDEGHDPDSILTADLSPHDPVFPARHSWLVPANQTAGLDGTGTIRALRLRGEPPLVRFILSLSNLLDANVTVREARAVDAVCEGFLEWDQNGPSPGITELVDGDVPRSAVEELGLRR